MYYYALKGSRWWNVAKKVLPERAWRIQALPYLKRAVARLPAFAEAHFNLGMVARQMLDIPTAVQSFRATVEYSDDVTPVNFSTASESAALLWCP